MKAKIKKKQKLKKTITLEKFYKQVIVEDLLLKQSYKNIMEIPKIIKIVINASSKVNIKDKKYLIPSLIALEIITGQKVKPLKAKKSIAAFKLRKAQLIGCKVTLRGVFLIRFLEKLVYLILPRLEDFRGLNKKNLYSKGHYNIGLSHFLLFFELEQFFEFFEFLEGVDISINTSAKNQKEAEILFSCFQIPIIKSSFANIPL